MTQIIENLTEVSDRYDVLFVDLWGCVHNGVTAFPEAVEALLTYRAKGGVVVLLTNSPKPRAGVADQLPGFDVPDTCWDVIASSGDSARSAMYQGAVGRKVWFMGEWDRDAGFFEPLNVIEEPVEIERVSLQEAEGIVCCGPFNPLAEPSVNRADFLFAKQQGMKLLCANPDIVVDRGETREWCAGALAALYTDMGGQSLYFGKPHPPIYDLARRRLRALGHDADAARVLAIGDGPHTDVAGAMGENIDSLFISGGLAAEETQTTDQPDETALAAYLQREKIAPNYTIGRLR